MGRKKHLCFHRQRFLRRRTGICKRTFRRLHLPSRVVWSTFPSSIHQIAGLAAASLNFWRFPYQIQCRKKDISSSIHGITELQCMSRKCWRIPCWEMLVKCRLKSWDKFCLQLSLNLLSVVLLFKVSADVGIEEKRVCNAVGINTAAADRKHQCPDRCSGLQHGMESGSEFRIYCLPVLWCWNSKHAGLCQCHRRMWNACQWCGKCSWWRRPDFRRKYLAR